MRVRSTTAEANPTLSIRSILPSLPPAERRVAEGVLAQPDEILSLVRVILEREIGRHAVDAGGRQAMERLRQAGAPALAGVTLADLELLDQVSDGASDYQFAMNGLMLIIVAVWFPAGILGSVGRIGRAATRDRA